MNTETKEVRHCEHIQAQEARPYMRLSGPEYDLIVCWKCQNDSAPYLNKLSEITDRLKSLTGARQ